MQTQSLPSISRERMAHLALFVFSVAFLLMWNTIDVHVTAIRLVPAFALFGAGLGLTLPRLFRSAPFLFGAVVSLVIVGAMFIGSMTVQLTNGVEKSKIIPEAYKAQFLQVLSAQTWDIILGAEAQGGKTWPESLSIEMTSIGHEARVSAVKNSIAIGSVLSALAFLASLVLLPEKKKQIAEESLFSELYTELIAIDLELTTALT
jgi:hypothetical protein